MDRHTHVVVPAPVPTAKAVRVAAPPQPPTAVIPVQPAAVPTASVSAVALARADAETVRRLQAQVDLLRAQLDRTG